MITTILTGTETKFPMTAGVVVSFVLRAYLLFYDGAFD